MDNENIKGDQANGAGRLPGVVAGITEHMPSRNTLRKAKKYWQILGPGLTTGAADDDPSGIATYSQTGAQFGFGLLWLAAFTFPLMAMVQEMCARIGMVTGRGLASNIRLHFPRSFLYVTTALLFAANVFNIGADLGAMAQGARLLLPTLNYAWLIIFFALLSVSLQIFVSYAVYARYLKWLGLVLFAYILSAFLSHLNWSEVLRSAVLPSTHFTRDELILVCGILGTTISPYLFFWQTSQEVEEEILAGKTNLAERRITTRRDIKNMRIDTWSGMFFSNIVMFFIIAACAGVLFNNGTTNIATAADAAEALRPFAGNLTYWLFSVGIIGVGLLAIPTLAGSASYAMAESLKWREGLYRPLRQAKSFYGVLIVAMIIGLGINFVHLDPIKALIYSAIGNGLVAPVVLILIVRLSADRKIMGEYVNRPSTTAIGWLVTTLMVLAGLAALYSLF